MNLFPKRNSKLKPSRFIRPRLENLEDRNVMAVLPPTLPIGDPEGDSLTSAMALNLGLGSLYKHNATIGDGSYPTKDVDLYSVSLTSGQRLTAVVVAQAPEQGGSLSAMDSYLRIFDSTGTQLTYNDDGANPFTGSSTADSSLKFVAPSTGLFYIGVCGYGTQFYNPSTEGSGSVGEQGSYRLELVKADVVAPSSPTGFSGSMASSGTVSLSWTASENATGYSLERRNATSTSNKWEALASLSATQTAYSDSPPNTNTKYEYRLQNLSLGGPSAYSSTAAVTTALAPPASVTATFVSGNQIDLNWTNPSPSMNAILIERSLSSSSGFSQIAAIAGNATSFSDSGPFQSSSTYYFRIRYFLYDEGAPEGGFYSSYSSTVSSTIPGGPNQPSNFLARSISTSEILLNWSDTANETSYRLEKLVSGNWSTVMTLAANQTDYVDAGLSPNASFTYRIIASNASGSSTPSLTSSATTNAVLQSGPTATIISGSRADFSWGTRLDDQYGTAIEQSLNGTTGWTQIGSVASGVTTFTSNGPFSGSTTYYFRLRSGSFPFGATVLGAYSSVTNATSTSFPNPLTGLAGLATSHSTVSLSWADATYETNYRIERQTPSLGSGWIVAGTVGANTTSFVDTALSENQTYNYRVFATNGWGESAPTSTEAKTLLAAPTNVFATSLSGSQIDLYWTDNSQFEGSYFIEHSSTGTGNWVQVATAGADETQFSVSGSFNSLTTYYFRVRAYANGNGSTYSKYSDIASVTTAAYPNQPTNLTATVVSASELSLQWSDTSNETGYRIEEQFSGTWATLTTLGANVASYQVTGLAAGSAHTYRVIALNASGWSIPSSSANATTMPQIPTFTVTIPSGTQISINWITPLDDSIETRIEGSADGVYNWLPIDTVSQAGSTYTSPYLRFSGSTKYYFRLALYQYSPLYVSAYSPTVEATSLAFPSVVTGITGVGTSHSTISLNWADTANETSYRIERYLSGWTIAGTVGQNVTSFVDTGLSENQTYYYQIIAINGAGESAPASSTQIRPLLASPINVAATVISNSQINLTWVDRSQLEWWYLIEQSTTGTGNWTQVGSVGTDETQYSVTSALNGSTTYYFRIRASAYLLGYGPNGFTNYQNYSLYSDTASATTPAYANQPTNLVATPLSDAQVKLTWNDTATETSYRIERQLNSVWTTLATLAANTTEYTHTGLTELSSNSYRIIGINSVGPSAPSATAAALTLPKAPAPLTATAISSSQINLAWSDLSNVETSYEIEQSPDGTSNWTNIASLPANANSFSAPGPFDGSTTYFFRVRAKVYSYFYPQGIVSAFSAYSPIASTTTAAYPGKPTGLVATPTSHSTIKLEWEDLTDETSYRIERLDQSVWPAVWISLGTVAANTTQFTASGLMEGYSYQFRVVAINALGQSPPSGVISGRTLLAAPTQLAATVYSGSRIDLSWVDNSAMEQSYYVEMATQANNDWRQVGWLSANATHFTATGPFNGSTDYVFRVKAYHPGYGLGYAYQYLPNSSLYSDFLQVQTPAFPNIPSGLQAVATTATSVSLSWTDLPNETMYRIERSDTANPFDWSLIDEVPANTTTYTDLSCWEGRPFYYRLIASNSLGNSAPSSTLVATTKLGTPTNLTATPFSGAKMALTWVDHSFNENGFTIEQSLNGTSGWVSVGWAAANVNHFDAPGPFLGSTPYYFRVKAIKQGPDIYPTLWNESAYSSIAQATTPAFPNPPTGLTSTLVTDTSVTLSWTDLANETDYMIERQVGIFWVAIDTVSANVTSYTDTNLEEQRSYVYRVTAMNLAGQSAASQSASVFTHLAAPTGLAAQVLSGGRIDLTWNDRSNYESYYIVEQSFDGLTWKAIPSYLSASNNSFSASGPFDGSTTYRFRVRAHKFVTVNSPEDDSPNSNIVTLTTPAFPNQPTGLAIGPVSATTVALSWNDLPNETGIRVERSSNSVNWIPTWSPIQTLPANTRAFVDSDVTDGLIYGYRIIALNESGESAPSLLQQVRTKPSAPSGLTATVASGGQIDLSWTDTSQYENGFQIEMLTEGIAGWRYIGGTAANQTSFSATRPFVGAKSYSFRVTTTTLDIGQNPGYLYSTPSNMATITTPAFPNQPSDFLVTGISDTELKLSWSDLANETQYRIERLISGTWNPVTTVPANTTSFAISGLTEYTEGTFRVVAINTLGESAPSLQSSARTFLAAPTNMVASAISGSRIDLSWDDLSSFEEYYIVEMSPNGTTGWTSIASLPANTETYSYNSGFNGSTPYHFRVRAYLRQALPLGLPLYSLYGQPTSVVTPAFPNAVTGLQLTPNSDSAIQVSWTDVSNETGYRIEHRSMFSSQWTIAGTVGQNVTSFPDSGLTEGTTYYYRITAINAAGESANAFTPQATTMLAAPSNLTAIYGSNTITLNWVDHSANEAQYEVEQSAGANGWKWIGSTSNLQNVTTFVFAGPVDGSTAYSFRVRAVGHRNIDLSTIYSQYSATGSVTTPVIPARPTGLKGTANSDTSITLNWADLPNETGYRIERLSGSQWGILATVAANATNYTDLNGLTEGTVATYRIIATGSNGDSPSSSLVSVSTFLKAPIGLIGSVISGSRIDLSWTDQSTKETGYIVEQSSNGTDWIQSGRVGANLTQFTVPGPFVGQTAYYFRARAVATQNSADSNWSLNSSTVSVTTPEYTAAPSNVVITSQTENSVSLSWSDVANETQYKIERLINGIWSLAGTTAAGVLTFTDSNLTEATAYSYRISGSNSLGVGTPSDNVPARTKLSKPTNVIAIVDSSAQATITWVDHSSSESNFTIEKSLNGTTGWTYVGLAAANAASYIAGGPFAGSTTYYFRVRANSNANGSSDWSQMASATTPAFPTQPTDLTIAAKSDASITVTWTDLPNESGYRVEKFVGNAWTTLQALNADVVSYTQSGLEEGSDHTYRIVAIANGVDSLPSDQINIRTNLKTPTNLTAQPTSASRIDLSWVDQSNHETGYLIEQSIDGTNNWFVTGRVDQNIHTYPAPGPFLGSVSYSFRVRATSVNGSSDTSTPITVATPAFPNAPSGLKGKALSDTSVSLSWTLGTGVTSYRIERAEKLYIGYGVWLPVQSLVGNQSSYVDSGLLEGTTFGYRVIASNTIGDSSPSGVLSVSTMPGTPTELTGTVASGGKIDLTWTDQSHSEISYAVEQQASSSSSWVQVGTSQTNSVSLPGPFDGNISYRFRVRAFSLDGGFSQYCEPFSLTTPNFPNQPLNFAATSLSTTEISFTWDPAPNTDHYSLQKLQDGPTEIWSEVGTILGTNQSYSLIGLPEGYRGSFRLIAINLQGSSSPSQSVSASTLLLPPTNLTATAISGGKIHLTWENLSTLRTGFAIEQSIDGLAWNPVNNLRANATEFDAYGPFQPSTQFYFRVKTVNDLAGTTSQYSAISSVLTPAYPNQPGSLSAIALGPTEIKLTWQVVANAQGYKIQRATSGQNEWTTIYAGQNGTLAFTDSALSEFSTYSYRLIASNSSGESAPSPIATAQTLLWSPGSLTASANSGSTLDLTWINRSTFTSSITFEISTNNINWLPLKTVYVATTSTSITKPLDGSTTYYIRSQTSSSYPFNHSPYSTTEITTPSYPNRPSLNNLVGLTSNSVQLSWIDLPNEASYSLERKMDGSALWSEVATIQANNTSYIDVNLSSSAKYIYRLSAVNNFGKSAYSEEVTALTLPDKLNNISATLITEDRLDLNWNRPEKTNTIRIESSLSSTGPWSLVGVSNPNSATFSVPGPFNSLTSYFFRLIAFNASGSSESAYVSFTTPALLSTPSNLLIESISPTSVQLSWQTAQQASQYYILRRITDGSWINIGQVSAGTLTYTDTSNLNIGVLYQYGVAAIYDERTSGIARSGLVLSGNGTDDADLDELPNVLEANLGTDPTNADTDGEGFSDGWEFDGEVFDPTQPDDPEGDEDEDGLSNWDEYEMGTDPGYGDSDEDGVEDALELTSGADPLNPSDEGIAPEPELISKFNLTLGIPNRHLWERWDVQVGNWTLTHTPGMGIQKEIQLKQGSSYPVYVRATMNTPYGVIPDQPVPGPMDPHQPHYGPTPTIRPAQGDENKPYFFSGDPQFFNTKSSFSDTVWYRNSKSVLNLPSLDVDVDSDNTNGFNLPDESAYEDSLEGHQDTVKMLSANTGNLDGDSFPDWADTKLPNQHFTPIVVKLSENIWQANPSDIVFTFDFSGIPPIGTPGGGTRSST